MPLPMTGGCQCGGVRYEITEEPLTLYLCHCTECQHQSASGFGMSLRVPSGGFRVVKGTPKAWERDTDSGRRMACVFCPDCGSRLYHQHVGNAPAVVVKAGSVDDTSWFDPVAHIYVRSKQPWVTIPEGIPAFDTTPDDPQLLVRLWQERKAD